MPRISFHKRYLLDISAEDIAHRFTDIAVLGSGAAGLRAAIEAAANGLRVVIVSKQAPEETNTHYAQGGVAAVLDDKNDSVDEHIRDTLAAGCGLCSEEAVRTIISEGPECIRELAAWGAEFDMEGGSLAFTREGGHRRARIIHAHGDATGNEIMSAMLRKARSFANVLWLENTFALDLLTEGETCRGVLISYGDELSAVWAKQVILATGGCGRLYRETTNPDIATGDGLSMAWRAGATLANMEMMQFHPTTLYVAGATRALISEAVRGEGGKLTRWSQLGVEVPGCADQEIIRISRQNNHRHRRQPPQAGTLKVLPTPISKFLRNNCSLINKFRTGFFSIGSVAIFSLALLMFFLSLYLFT